MKTIQLAKNEQSFKILDDWHTKFEAAIPYAFTTRRIETSFGHADVIISGNNHCTPPTHEPPILILHGAMAGAPFALGEVCDLPARRRIYAVNIPGQSTRAAQIRLDFNTGEYGRWLCEVMEGLGIDKPIVCGVSWGGSVALQLAKHFPDRLSGLLLVVPGSIVSGPVFKNLWNVALPIIRFKLFPTERNRDQILQHILTSNDTLWSPYLGDAIRHWNVDFRAPPLMQTEDLESLDAPVYVIAADQDISFPGECLLARSSKLFPNLVGEFLLKNSKHSPSFRPADRIRFTEIFEQALEKLQDSSVNFRD